MEDRLYYRNPYLNECSTKVLQQRSDDRGFWLQLESNLFYPGGGGQLPDKGTIGDSALDEIVEEDGVLWHRLNSGDKFTDGDKVEVKIDWAYRYANMRQHTGQHLLSHVLWKAGLKTVSVHLGDTNTMIEVEGGFPDDEKVDRIEREANQLIRQALPVNTFFAKRDAIKKLPLRKPPGDRDILRIVEIAGLDYSACGGTHVKNTSEIGLIKYIGHEKIRGHVRLKFLIGDPAYAYLGLLHEITGRLKDFFQTDPAQFPAKAQSTIEELTAVKKENNQLRKYYVRYLSYEIMDKSNTAGAIIIHHLPDASFDDLKEISRRLAGEYGKINFIYGKGRFCLSAPGQAGLDTSAFLKEHGSPLTLRGGGPQGFVQGIYEDLDPDKLKGILQGYME